MFADEARPQLYQFNLYSVQNTSTAILNFDHQRTHIMPCYLRRQSYSETENYFTEKMKKTFPQYGNNNGV